MQNKHSSIQTQTNHQINSNSIRIPPIPSIIGIGPEKCGTTTLADYISFKPHFINEFVKPQTEPSGVTWEMRSFMKCGGSDLIKTKKMVLHPGTPAIGENRCSLGWYQHFWPIMHNDIRYKSLLDDNWDTIHSQQNDTNMQKLVQKILFKIH